MLVYNVSCNTSGEGQLPARAHRGPVDLVGQHRIVVPHCQLLRLPKTPPSDFMVQKTRCLGYNAQVTCKSNHRPIAAITPS